MTFTWGVARRAAVPVLCLSSALLGQTTAPPEPRRETVVITGTYEPLAVEEVDRSVRVLPLKGQELLVNTITDLLRLDPSLDLRQRAGNGIQGDLSIRGGNFGQTLILLDGQRLNDAQSGHHNLDLPLPLESVERIEILRGAGSTLYGSDAVGGVVNVVTRRPEAAELRVRAAAGNFGVDQQSLSLGFVRGRWSQQLSAFRDFSSGFEPDRDYRNLTFTSGTQAKTALGASSVTLGYTDRPFGADQFYGNFPSWERTKTWFAGLRQDFGEHTEASFSYRRHTDLFVLYRDRPQVYTNRHAVESWTGALRRRDRLADNVKLYYGAEGYGDSIDSSNLGSHRRARGAGYASFDARALRRFSFTSGLRQEVYRGFPGQFSPSVSAGLWLAPRLKVRAGVSRAFRVPTYTDLYYQDPANRGNPSLRPERAWSYEAGLDGSTGGRVPLRGELVVFHRRETDGIDYVRTTLNDLWRAVNVQNLRFTGVEASAGARLARSHRLEFRYTGLRGVAQSLPNLLSKYSFNYPVHSGVAEWQGSFRGGWLGRVRAGALERRARDPYAVLDAYVAHQGNRIRPFLQLTNLSGTTYQEILGVAMPGRAVVGGLEIALFSARTR